MPVPTSFADLSTTPASNSPAGSENVFPDLDDYIRFINAALASISANTATNGWVSPYVAGSGSWAIPGTIGSTTPNTGAFTTLSASGTVSGAGFTARFADPGPIGSTTPSTIAGTTGTFSNGLDLTGSVVAGYAAGSGGTVTQATDKFTTVVLNKPTGRITTFNDLLASGSTANFILTNSTLTLPYTVILNIVGGVTDVRNYTVAAGFNATSSVQILLRNISGGPLSESVQIQFTVLKGATT